jgi:pilus assembly protein Flp/PilA
MNKGQGLVEYSLILVLAAVVVIVVMAILGPLVANLLDGEDNKVVNQPPVSTIRETDWQEITPPPGYNGKCYMTLFNYWGEVTHVMSCIPDSDL